MQSTTVPYPVDFDVDYPDSQRNRLTTAFRAVLALPMLAVLSVFSGVLLVPPLLTIVFRQKYPRWWFDFNEAYLRFTNRVFAYVLLLRDEYPSTDEEQSVHLRMAYPDARGELNRWMPLVKWFLAIPHYIALALLGVAVLFATIAAWFTIVVTGRHPRGLFTFVVGVMRWHNRVVAYAVALVIDQYPPFRLAP
jgi:hypothetical protein